MVTNFEAALLYKFLASSPADNLSLSLDGNIAVQENIRGIKDFYQSMVAVEAKQKRPTEEYLTYQRKRDLYIQEYAARDEDGNIIQAEGGIRLNNVGEFNKVLEVLMTSYRDVIEDHENKLREWEEYINSEYEGKISMIDKSDVKFDKLSKLDFEALMTMIKQPEERVQQPVKQVERDLSTSEVESEATA